MLQILLLLLLESCSFHLQIQNDSFRLWLFFLRLLWKFHVLQHTALLSAFLHDQGLSLMPHLQLLLPWNVENVLPYMLPYEAFHLHYFLQMGQLLPLLALLLLTFPSYRTRSYLPLQRLPYIYRLLQLRYAGLLHVSRTIQRLAWQVLTHRRNQP